jgi:hypothetical protein
MRTCKKFDTKQGTIVQLTNFKSGKEKDKEVEKRLFLNKQKNYFNLYVIRKKRRIGIKPKSMK